jgi:UPF0716 protein FxsA
VVPLLILLFIVVPIAELAVIIQIGQAIGVLWTVLLLIVDSILGSMLMRHQGRATWRRFNAALLEGRIPARETIDGALVIFGGALLLTPGFISDIFGLVCLLPPTRAVVRRVLVARFAHRMTSGMTIGPIGPRSPQRPDYDVEGTAHDVGPGRSPQRPDYGGVEGTGHDIEPGKR